MTVECACTVVLDLSLHSPVMLYVFAGLREGQLLSSFWHIGVALRSKVIHHCRVQTSHLMLKGLVCAE